MYKKVKELKIFYKISKNGKICKDSIPILFLHGWGGSTKSFEWFYNKLEKTFFCITLDFPPFGKSSKLNDIYSINDYAKLVLEILNKNNIKKINIVAHSFGGRVALELASKFKNDILVCKMVLTGCAGLKNKKFKTKLKIANYKIKKFLCYKIHILPKKFILNCGSEDYKILDDITKKTFINIVNYDQKYLLKNIDAKTLLVFGSSDKDTPIYFTKIFKKHIKYSEVIIFKDCSHFAYLQRPYAFLNILEKFFNS